MKSLSLLDRRNLPGLLLALNVVLAAETPLHAQTSAFTYQGRLDSAGQPASGSFDLRFTLHSVPAGGGVLPGTTLTNMNVAVSNGLFTTTVDFGAAVFDGGPRWMETGVRSNAVGGTFTVLTPRQAVSPTPYAISAGHLSGSVLEGQLPLNIARLNQSQAFSEPMLITNRQNVIAGTGTGLTNLDAGNISQGTLPNGRLSTDVARRAGGNTFTGDQTFTNGQVGIGMASTTYPLSLKGLGVFSEYIRLQDSGGTNRWHIAGQSNGLNFVETAVADYRLFLAPGGNVGVGTGTPATRLHVNGTVTATGYSGNGSGLSFNSGLLLPTAFGPNATFVGTAGNSISFGHLGVSEDFIGYKNNTFYFMDSPGGADTAQPNVVVGGNVEAAMLILTGGADLSEGFGLTDDATPGMVVCIDPENPGKVKTSQRAYDRTVAGIISGAGGVNTGLMMSQKGSVAHGDHPVALTGRVYCWADASAGAIEPGDLLTSADVPGHAMKVTDHSRSPGAVLGKAMTGLKQGKGLVLVLVSLQ